jgi:hypothetical protein
LNRKKNIAKCKEGHFRPAVFNVEREREREREEVFQCCFYTEIDFCGVRESIAELKEPETDAVAHAAATNADEEKIFTIYYYIVTRFARK